MRRRTENSARKTRVRGRVGNSGLLASERGNVSSVNGNGIRGRVESGRGWARGRAENSVRKTRGRVSKSGLLASVRHTSRYGGFSSNGNNNNIKRSARNVRGWVSERSNVSSVRNGNGIRGRVESG